MCGWRGGEFFPPRLRTEERPEIREGPVSCIPRLVESVLHSVPPVHSVRARCGIRQRDPLPPLLFNPVVGTGLRAIQEAVGYTLGQTVVNVIAFEVDVIFVAETPSGLRLACEAFTKRLKIAGLSVNPVRARL